MYAGHRIVPFLRAQWRDLAMINYAIDPSVLAARVPAGTELDAWNGTTYVSVVGFLFERTRVLGVPIPLHQRFEEVNLRFYVRHRAEEGWRRGVVFVKEIVPRWAVAAVARCLYNERYVSMPMRHDIAKGSVEYFWRPEERWNRLKVQISGEPAIPSPGSEEEFITEHYWGYSPQKNGGTHEYRVEHPQWPVWNGSAAELDCDVAAIYGPEFVEALSQRPTSMFVAEGSAVTVGFGSKIV